MAFPALRPLRLPLVANSSDETTVLITVTGPDKPGVTSTLMGALAGQRVSLLDVEQVVIRGRLTLGVLVSCTGDPQDVQEVVEQAMDSVGIDVHVEVGANSGDNITVGALANTKVDKLGKTTYATTKTAALAAADISALATAIKSDTETDRQITITGANNVTVTATIAQDKNVTDDEALGKVLEAINGQLVETLANGDARVIRPLHTPLQVSVGMKRTRKLTHP